MRLRAVWEGSEVLEETRAGLRALATDLAEDESLEELAERLEIKGEETLPCFHFPSTHRLRIRTINGLERINQKIEPPRDCRRFQLVRG